MFTTTALSLDHASPQSEGECTYEHAAGFLLMMLADRKKFGISNISVFADRVIFDASTDVAPPGITLDPQSTSPRRYAILDNAKGNVEDIKAILSLAHTYCMVFPSLRSHFLNEVLESFATSSLSVLTT